MRIFADGTYGTPLAFQGQMNHCAEAFWTARWRSLNPDVTVVATRAPYNADTIAYPVSGLEPLPPAASGGYISGHICERPVFIFGEALNGNASNLGDIVIDWQYWDAAP